MFQIMIFVYELLYYELELNLGAKLCYFAFLVQYKKVDTKHVYVL